MNKEFYYLQVTTDQDAQILSNELCANETSAKDVRAHFQTPPVESLKPSVAYQGHLCNLNKTILQVQEEERKRISRELHDDTIQSLIVLKMEIESLNNSPEIQSEAVRNKLASLYRNTDRAISDIRRYSHELRPGILDLLGLEAALEQLAADNKVQSGIDFIFIVSGEKVRLTPDIELALFRIAQEAMSNICKHSQAGKAEIHLHLSYDKVKLIISDNGKGYQSEENQTANASSVHLGLLGMRERAHLIGASLNIRSVPGKGTTVNLELPGSFL